MKNHLQPILAGLAFVVLCLIFIGFGILFCIVWALSSVISYAVSGAIFLLIELHYLIKQ